MRIACESTLCPEIDAVVVMTLGIPAYQDPANGNRAGGMSSVIPEGRSFRIAPEDPASHFRSPCGVTNRPVSTEYYSGIDRGLYGDDDTVGVAIRVAAGAAFSLGGTTTTTNTGSPKRTPSGDIACQRLS